ncbi:MAG TPA: flagellar motor switch protein FliN [Solirubrobacteraceae bacterium]|nr:flagellar motor switch protein FliN [Solirubrobacteraceae bacterium]
MSETIEYEQFETPAGGAGAHGDADLRRLSEIPMELSVEIGRTQTTVGDTLDLRVGSLIELEREAGAPADLLVNGTAIARGEVVVVDMSYGLRITEILDTQDASEHAISDGGSQDGTAAPDAEPAGVEAPAGTEG